jgi:hypothetical protein
MDTSQKLRDCYAQRPQSWPGFAPAVGLASADGLVLEFGVGSGGSFNQLCGLFFPRTVFGFDWFYGLPEHWNDYNPKGKFSTCGVVPSVATNGVVVVGLVQDTLGDFLEVHPGPLAFAHLDLDLYSSTKCALDAIAPRCVDGTVLLFDEIFGNSDHEERAFLEFLEATDFDFEFVTRRNRDAVAFRLHAR